MDPQQKLKATKADWALLIKDIDANGDGQVSF